MQTKEISEDTQMEEVESEKYKISVDDSILSEPAKDLSEGSAGGAVTGCDLGSTIASIMHHAPVLNVCKTTAADKFHVLLYGFWLEA